MIGFIIGAVIGWYIAKLKFNKILKNMYEHQEYLEDQLELKSEELNWLKWESTELDNAFYNDLDELEKIKYLRCRKAD